MGLIDFPASPEAKLATYKNFTINVLPCVKDVGEQLSAYILRVGGSRDYSHGISTEYHYVKSDRKDTNLQSSTRCDCMADVFLWLHGGNKEKFG